MAHPLFFGIPYVEPYPRQPIFWVVTVLALVIQIILASKGRWLRWLLPVLGLLIVAVAIPVGLRIPPQPGVFFGDLENIINIALPGAAILWGSTLGSVLRWLYLHLI